MKALRLRAWVSLVVLGHLLFASAARAQDAQPAGAPPPPPPAATPPPPAPPAPGAPVDQPVPQVQDSMIGPVVSINSTNPRARLQTMKLTWQDVCTAPCRVAVDPNGTYRIGGGPIRPSDEFRMPRPSGSVVITTETGSTIKHWVGLGLILAGVGSAAGGAWYYADGDQLKGTTKDAAHAGGIVDIVIGVVLVAVGIPFAMSSTSVDVR